MENKNLKMLQSEINVLLKEFFQKKQEETKNLPPAITEACKEVEKITRADGKRIRPMFIYFAYKMCGGKQLKEIEEYYLSLELLQTFALIHDDIIDSAKKRRGVETIHSVYSKRHNDEKLGESMAILCGDLAYAWSDECFYKNTKKQNTLSKVFEEMKQQVIFGQLLDVLGPKTKQEAIDVMKWKTASYSVEKPLILGALLANANQKQINALSECGQNIGLAFQLKDDIQGVFGSEEKLGKSTNEDIKNGKQNLLYFYTIENAIENEKKEFTKIWGNKTAKVTDIEKVKQIIKQSKALEKTVKQYSEWKESAQLNLSRAQFTEGPKKEFEAMIHTILAFDRHDLVQ